LSAATATALRGLSEGLVTVRIVLFAFVVVAKNIVRSCSLFEFLGSTGFFVSVRMVLLRELSKD
jgi:hypothetical protein